MTQLLEFYHNINGFFLDFAGLFFLFLFFNLSNMGKEMDKEMTKLEARVADLNSRIYKLENPN